MIFVMFLLCVFVLQLWRDVYLIVISVLFASVMLFQTSPRYLSSGFYKQLLLYLCLAGYGIIPTIHWVYLNGGLHSRIVQVGSWLFLYVWRGRANINISKYKDLSKFIRPMKCMILQSKIIMLPTSNKL